MGEAEVWTNDRHMLKACGSFGLRGRSIEYTRLASRRYDRSAYAQFEPGISA